MPIVVTTRGPEGQLVEMPITGDASLGDAAAAAAASDALDAPAAPGPEAQPADSSPAVPTAPASGEDAGETEETDAPDETPITAGYVNRRIGQITRYRRQAERALEEARAAHQQELAGLRGQLEVMTRLMQGQSPDLGAPPPPAGPPQAEQYQSHDDYITAKARYEAQQVLEQQRQQTQQAQQQQALMDREAAFKAAHPDFDQLVNTNLRGKVAPHVQQALMMLPDGPELAYALAQQPDALAQLNQLPPPQMLLALGRLSPAQAPAPAHATTTNGTAPPVPIPATPVLPPPPTPLSGSGQGVPPDTPADWSQAEFTKRWNAGWRPGPRDFGR